MTNLLSNIILFLTVQTNWTGYNFKNQELGVIVTNINVSVEWYGTTNTVVVDTVKSEHAIWRNPTNFIWIGTNSSSFIKITKGWKND